MEETKTKLQKVLNILGIIISAVVIIYFIFKWTSLPDTIPMHYNFAGEVDRMGSKSGLIMLAIVMILLTGSLIIIEKHPKLWNTGVEITEKNRVRVYTALRNMLCVTRFMLILVFSYLILVSCQLFTMEAWFMPTFIITCSIIVIYFIVKIYKIPKSEKEENL